MYREHTLEITTRYNKIEQRREWSSHTYCCEKRLSTTSCKNDMRDSERGKSVMCGMWELRGIAREHEIATGKSVNPPLVRIVICW